MSNLTVLRPGLREGDLCLITVEVSAATQLTVDYAGETVIDDVSVTDTYSYEYTIPYSNLAFNVYLDDNITGTLWFTVKKRNYHNLYNNGAGVLRFKEGMNAWTSFNTFEPEQMVNLGDYLYSFKNGINYVHKGTEGNRSIQKSIFYGKPNDSVISFRVTETKTVIKVLEYIVMESNTKPKYINVQVLNPYTQQTNLCPDDIVYRDGDYYASFLFDMMSPNAEGETEPERWWNGLLNGDQLTGTYFDIFLIFDNADDFVLKSVDIGMKISTGHRRQ